LQGFTRKIFGWAELDCRGRRIAGESQPGNLDKPLPTKVIQALHPTGIDIDITREVSSKSGDATFGRLPGHRRWQPGPISLQSS
jgi:hypothetical protein